MNSVITELSEIWVGLKLVYGKTRHRQSQGSAERANRGIEDVLTTWLKSNSTTHSDDGLQFVQVMKNRAYHEDIKCFPCEAMFGQPMKVGLKHQTFLIMLIEDIFTKGKLERVVSGEHKDEQNNLIKDSVEEIHVETPNGTSNDLVDNADMEEPVFVDVQEETGTKDLPSTEW